MLAWIAVLLAPSTAAADLFVAHEGESVVPVARRVVIAHHLGRESLIEELELTTTAPHFLWFRAFPVAPQVRGGNGDLFRTLDQNTIVEEPFNEQIRKSLFGPSVVTLLTRRLVGEPQQRETKVYDETLRDVRIEEPRLFTGKVYTSTVTLQLVLPDELTLWLNEQGINMSDEQKREVARYLNRDWILVAASVIDQAPNESQRARLGPLRYDFSSRVPLYPQMGLDRPWLRTPPSEFYLLASGPLAPLTLRTVWDVHSWERRSPARSQFIATWSHPLDLEGPIAFAFQEGEVRLAPEPFLVRAAYDRGDEVLSDLSFVPAKDAVVIPGDDHRGSPTDIFLCMLLGLTPLIYTPESWFLLWLAGRAKARARTGVKAFGVRLWSLYAIVVAIFWFVTLEGAGRLAALAPMLVGIVQLAIPYTERNTSPVRVQFKKRKPS